MWCCRGNKWDERVGGLAGFPGFTGWAIRAGDPIRQLLRHCGRGDSACPVPRAGAHYQSQPNSLSSTIKLSKLSLGESGRISDLEGDPALVQRLLEMGLTEGETVSVERFAPLGDPIEIRVRGYHLSLRRQEADAILVEKFS